MDKGGIILIRGVLLCTFTIRGAPLAVKAIILYIFPHPNARL